MMPDGPLFSGWNSTDDEPVRASANIGGDPGIDNISISPKAKIQVIRQDNPDLAIPSSRSMKLSALTGIGLVLIGAAFYFGVMNLRGQLSASNSVNVTITSDGWFDPPKIVVHAGDIITIQNSNKDPQVLKVKEGKELFPVQVIFQTPFTFTVPSGVEGTYTYVSETMPSDRDLTITVETLEASSSSSESTPPSGIASSPDSNPVIPLPFGNGNVELASSSSSSAAAVPSTVSTSVGPDNDTLTIALGTSSRSSSLSPLDSSNIPTNPYTVGNPITKTPTPASTEIAKVKAEENLHSGAPLRELRNHTPENVTSTGPEGTWLMVIPSLFGVMLMFRKMKLEN